MKNSTPLRYNISKWNQLTGCLSNNSRDLFISVSSLLGDTISGTLIEVRHSAYGTLFAAIHNGKGKIVSSVSDANVQLNWMTTEEILEQLGKFGFFVTYQPQMHLSGKMIEYLITLDKLSYDHITKINVITFAGTQQYVTETVVAFNTRQHQDWLSFGCPVSEAAFKSALADGTCLNISAISEKKNFRWDWLTYVASIADVVTDQSGIDPI